MPQWVFLHNTETCVEIEQWKWKQKVTNFNHKISKAENLHYLIVLEWYIIFYVIINYAISVCFLDNYIRTEKISFSWLK